MENAIKEAELKNKGLGRKVSDGLKSHVVDTTALLASTGPIYAASEVFIAGMTDEVSIGSRLTIAGISYAGIGFAFAKGRDLSRKLFKITGESKERAQLIHDFGYTSAFNLVVAPIIYLSMGADIKQAAVGGVAAAGLSVIYGPIMGYAIDASRDLMGIETCDRKHIS